MTSPNEVVFDFLEKLFLGQSAAVHVSEAPRRMDLYEGVDIIGNVRVSGSHPVSYHFQLKEPRHQYAGADTIVNLNHDKFDRYFGGPPQGRTAHIDYFVFMFQCGTAAFVDFYALKQAWLSESLWDYGVIQHHDYTQVPLSQLGRCVRDNAPDAQNSYVLMSFITDDGVGVKLI